MRFKKAITGIVFLIFTSACFGQSSTAELARQQERERQRRQLDMEANKRYQQNQTKSTPGNYANKYSATSEIEKKEAKEREAAEKLQMQREGKHYTIFDETSTLINENGLRRVRVKNKYGFIDARKVIRIGVLYDYAAESFYKGLVSVTMKSQIGYLDEYGRLIVSYSTNGNAAYEKPASFDTRGNFAMHRAVVSRNNKFGYINESDEILIPLVYDGASSFSEGLAAVKTGNKHGYIDPYGTVVIPVIYDDAAVFSKGLAGVRLNGKWGFINVKGQVVIPLKYTSTGIFQDSLALVQLGKKWGYINLIGKTVIPIIYDESAIFINGKVEFRLNGKSAFFDRTGKKLAGQSPVAAMKQPVVEIVKTKESYYEGLAIVQVNKKWGYKDLAGNVVIPAEYEDVWIFQKGVAAVQLNGLWGYIDKKGKMIVPNIYLEPGYLEIKAQLLRGKTYKGYGVINFKGETIVPFIYDHISSILGSDKLISVQLKGKWGCLGKQGNVVIPVKYDKSLYFWKGHSTISLNNKMGVVNEKGDIIVPVIYDEVKQQESFFMCKMDNKWLEIPAPASK
jgi:WG containing repeat